MSEGRKAVTKFQSSLGLEEGEELGELASQMLVAGLCAPFGCCNEPGTVLGHPVFHEQEDFSQLRGDSGRDVRHRFRWCLRVLA